VCLWFLRKQRGARAGQILFATRVVDAGTPLVALLYYFKSHLSHLTRVSE